MYSLNDRDLKILINDQQEINVRIPDDLPILDSLQANDIPSVNCVGADNRVIIGTDVKLDGVTININGSRNTLIVGSNAILKGIIQIKNSDSLIYIGAHTTFNSVRIYNKGEGGQIVYIGKDCMLSSAIEIRTCDAHSIIDLTTNNKINKDQDVFIGAHTWVGKSSLIQKGAHIPENSVIGFGSFVNKKFKDSNQIFAGTPAQSVKRNTTWSRHMRTQRAIDDINKWRDLPEL